METNPLQEIMPLTAEELDTAISLCTQRLKENTLLFSGCFPGPHTVQGMYPKSDNYEWTPGFFTGMQWLCYELTGDACFCEAGLAGAQSFLQRVQDKYCIDNHDLGFLYTPSCVAAHKLTGSAQARQAALLAADALLLRFQEKGQFIQAWGQAGRPEHYRMIIDCLLNVPLLYWATGQTGRQAYRAAALAHSETAMHCLFRPDGSTFHTFYFEPSTGAPLRGETAQGYSNETAWARGQAWGIYGLALYHRYTGRQDVKELFERVLDYYLGHLPAAGIPYWDLSFPEGSGEPWDSSAAAIAACGLLEMARNAAGPQREQWQNLAGRIAGALFRSCQAGAGEETNGLLLHGVYNKSSPFNARQDAGVDECNLWGDYFWLELLTRLKMDWEPYW